MKTLLVATLLLLAGTNSLPSNQHQHNKHSKTRKRQYPTPHPFFTATADAGHDLPNDFTCNEPFMIPAGYRDALGNKFALCFSDPRWNHRHLIWYVQEVNGSFKAVGAAHKTRAGRYEGGVFPIEEPSSDSGIHASPVQVHVTFNKETGSIEMAPISKNGIPVQWHIRPRGFPPGTLQVPSSCGPFLHEMKRPENLAPLTGAEKGATACLLPKLVGREMTTLTGANSDGKKTHARAFISWGRSRVANKDPLPRQNKRNRALDLDGDWDQDDIGSGERFLALGFVGDDRGVSIDICERTGGSEAKRCEMSRLVGHTRKTFVLNDGQTRSTGILTEEADAEADAVNQEPAHNKRRTRKHVKKHHKRAERKRAHADADADADETVQHVHKAKSNAIATHVDNRQEMNEIRRDISRLRHDLRAILEHASRHEHERDDDDTVVEWNDHRLSRAHGLKCRVQQRFAAAAAANDSESDSDNDRDDLFPVNFNQRQQPKPMSPVVKSQGHCQLHIHRTLEERRGKLRVKHRRSEIDDAAHWPLRRAARQEAVSDADDHHVHRRPFRRANKRRHQVSSKDKKKKACKIYPLVDEAEGLEADRKMTRIELALSRLDRTVHKIRHELAERETVDAPVRRARARREVIDDATPLVDISPPRARVHARREVIDDATPFVDIPPPGVRARAHARHEVIDDATPLVDIPPPRARVHARREAVADDLGPADEVLHSRYNHVRDEIIPGRPSHVVRNTAEFVTDRVSDVGSTAGHVVRNTGEFVHDGLSNVGDVAENVVTGTTGLVRTGSSAAKKGLRKTSQSFVRKMGKMIHDEFVGPQLERKRLERYREARSAVLQQPPRQEIYRPRHVAAAEWTALSPAPAAVSAGPLGPIGPALTGTPLSPPRAAAVHDPTPLADPYRRRRPEVRRAAAAKHEYYKLQAADYLN